MSDGLTSEFHLFAFANAAAVAGPPIAADEATNNL
jgi:hypothetical protein